MKYDVTIYLADMLEQIDIISPLRIIFIQLKS